MTESPAIQAHEKYLEDLFTKIGKKDNKFLTDHERVSNAVTSGAKKFKRKTLGICGGEAVKSLDELSEILVDIGMVANPEEARKTVPQMTKALNTMGGIRYGAESYLKIKEVENAQGEVKYRIYTYGLRW